MRANPLAVGRRCLVALLALLLLGTGVALAAGDDPRDAPSAADLVARVNAERAQRGLQTLTVASDLADVARRHSLDMAAQQRLYHNPALGSQVRNWRMVGENVGTGPDAATVHAAFMASDVHREVLLTPQFQEIGVGAVWAGDRLWVTEVFRQPEAAAAPPPAPAAAAGASRPRPARPAPAPTPPPPPPPPPPATTTTTAPPPSAPTPSPAPPAPVRAEVAGATLTHSGRAPCVPSTACAAAPALPAERVPAAAALAAALLALAVGGQHAALRRLGLVTWPGHRG